MRLSVQRLEKLGDPPSLVDLRKRVAAMLPVVDLPEVLMDVHSWTGMLDAYTHVAPTGKTAPCGSSCRPLRTPSTVDR